MGILLFSIPIKWPSQSSPLIMMSVTVCVSRHRFLRSSFVVIRLVPLSQMDTYIFTTDGVVWFMCNKDSWENRWFIRNIDTYTPNDNAEVGDLNVTECKCVFEGSPVPLCVQSVREYLRNRKIGYYYMTFMTFLSSITKHIEIAHWSNTFLVFRHNCNFLLTFHVKLVLHFTLLTGTQLKLGNHYYLPP